MQNTSPTYNEIIASENHWFETRLAIGESGRLIDRFGDAITFGGQTILVDTGGAETGFDETTLISVSTSHRVFSKNVPIVGSAVSGEIDIEMHKPPGEIPRMARLAPYVRATDGVRVSEWLPKGVYFIDTRFASHNDNGLVILTIHGYDSMVQFEQDYPSDDEHDYPLLDQTMVQHIAESIGIGVDPRTFERMNKGYMFPLPVGYSSREMLGFIAGAYGGNFVISDENQLLLVKLGDLPKETNYLIDPLGNAITFGEDRQESTETYTGSIVSFLNYGEKTITGLTVNSNGNSAATVTRCGKNIIDTSAYWTNGTSNGITYTRNADGSIHLQGTSNNNNGYRNIYPSAERWILPVGTYIASGGTANAQLRINTYTANGTLIARVQVKDTPKNVIVTEETGYILIAVGYVANGSTVDDTIYPQLELGSTTSAYEPYQGNTYTVQVGQTDHQVNALLGQNNIWADTGAVSVTVDTSASEATRILV